MNSSNLPQRIRWVNLIVLVGLAIGLTILDSTGNLRVAFEFLRDPMATLLSWTADRTDNVTDALDGPRDLQAAREEIVRLQAEIETLERENEELRETQGEYQLLLDLFNRAREAPELERVLASTIGLDTNPAIRSIIIDKGRDDGVRVGMPVESARGLVGQVFRTTENSAQVLLITDNISSIPARLGSSRATGILRGGGLGGSMTIDWIDLKYQLEVGEVVLSSGLGGKFPQDVVIGRVLRVNRREADLFQQAIIQPAVDFESLEIVFVVTNFEPVNTEIFSTSPAP